MSGLKRIWIMFLGLMMSLVSACDSRQIQLETGESFVYETEDTTLSETEMKLQEVDSKALIYVYVCGQVISPGVYVLSEGDRMYQALEMAGGVLPEGDVAKLNLAEQLSDGQKIYVPSFEEAETWEESHLTEESSTGGLVNINQASKELLMTLPGIGESKADAIVIYREENGLFHSTDDLMMVPGIKEGVYSKIKDRISIN